MGIPLLLGAALVLRQLWERNELLVQRDFQERTKAVAASLDQKLTEFQQIGNQLTFTPWVERARSTSPLIYGELDYMKKQEICVELANYKAFLEIASNIAVYFPQKDTVVNQRRWWRTDAFFYELGGSFTAQEKAGLLKEVASGGPFSIRSLASLGVGGDSARDILITQNLDVTTVPKAVLMISVKAKSLEKYLASLGRGIPFHLSVRAGEQELFSSQSNALPAGVALRSAQLPSVFGLRYQLDMADVPLGENAYFPVITAAFLLAGLFLAVLLSYVLAGISYRPIERLVRKTGLDGDALRTENEVTAIENTFDDLVSRQSSLETAVHQYYAAARNNFLLQLLHGYFEKDDLRKRLREFSLPYEKSSAVQVLLCGCTAPEGDASPQRLSRFLLLQSYFQKECPDAELLPLSPEQTAVIRHARSVQGLRDFRDAARETQEFFARRYALPVSLICGSVELGELGVSKSYQSAKEEEGLDREPSPALPRSLRFYYPTDWEVQLINYLKLGKPAQACKILRELRLENQRRGLPEYLEARLTASIYETLLRVGMELGLTAEELTPSHDAPPQPGEAARRWDLLFGLAEIVGGRTAESELHPLGQSLLRYMEENYADPNLSLKELEDKFQLSATKISRAVKIAAKLTFYDCLCRIRIGHAKRLLAEGVTVEETARRVGYENEASFKRFFRRYEGVLPKDYRKRPPGNELSSRESGLV